MAQTLYNHLTDELGMITVKSDPYLYFSFCNGKYVGLKGSYVEELIRAGVKRIQKEW